MAIVADKYKKQNFSVYVDSEGAITSDKAGRVYVCANNSFKDRFFEALLGDWKTKKSDIVVECDTGDNNDKHYNFNSGWGFWGGSGSKISINNGANRVIDAIDIEWAPYKITNRKAGSVEYTVLRSSTDLIGAINAIYEYVNSLQTQWGDNLYKLESK